jgi:hypothetical protein
VTSHGPGKKPTSTQFQVICAWCGKVESRPAQPQTDAPSAARGPVVFDAKPPAPTPALPVSHTICEECFVKERASVERVVKYRRKRSSA